MRWPKLGRHQRHEPIEDSHRHWVVVESAGGLTRSIESCIPVAEVVFIEVDYDELEEVTEEEALEYYTEKLLTLREWVGPGNYRKFLRRRMAEGPYVNRGQGYEWAYPREET